MSFVCLFLSRVDWSNARPWSSTKYLQHSGTSRRNNSEPEQATAQLVKKYGQRLLLLLVLSLLSLWRPVPGKNIKEVSCESFQLCGLYPPPEGGWLTGCRYTFVYERRWTTWVVPAIWKTIKQSYERSLNSLMRNRKAWFLSNSREWMGAVNVAKWAVII